MSQVAELLDVWPKVKAENALELLDYNYAEPIVRDYAVECIREFRSDGIRNQIVNK